MYLLMRMFADSDLEDRTFAAVCGFDMDTIKAIAKFRRIAAEANDNCAAVQHVSFHQPTNLDVYEVDYVVDDDDNESLVTESGVRLPMGAGLSMADRCAIAPDNPFGSSEEAIRTDLDEFVVRVVRDFDDNPSVLSFSWECYEKHTGIRMNSSLFRPSHMNDLLKELRGPMPAATRLGHEFF